MCLSLLLSEKGGWKMDVKQELARKAESVKGETKLTKSMSISDMIKVMEPEIKRALPKVITPEGFSLRNLQY